VKAIEAQIFYKSLVETLTKYRIDLSERWDQPANYTRFIMDVILPEVGKNLEMECYAANYYTLDCVYYEECDLDHFRTDTTYVKYVAVALEHENFLTGSCVEMNKLQLFNTPLKVLITYSSPRQVSTWLTKYADIVRKADIFQDAATLRRQLVVFGDKPGEFPIWRGFIYEPEGFLEIATACDKVKSQAAGAATKSPES